MSARAHLRLYERGRGAAAGTGTGATARVNTNKAVLVDHATKSLLLGIINNPPAPIQVELIFRFDPFGSPSFEDQDTAPAPTVLGGFPMSAEGLAMFEALALIRERARAVGRWRDDVKIAMGEDRIAVYPTWPIKIHEPYLFDFSSVNNTPASSPRPDLEPDSPLASIYAPNYILLPVGYQSCYPIKAPHDNPLLASGVPIPVYSPPAAPIAHTVEEVEQEGQLHYPVPAEIGLGISADVEGGAAVDVAETSTDPMSLLLSSLSSPSSTSTFSLPSTSWDERTLGGGCATPSPHRASFALPRPLTPIKPLAPFMPVEHFIPAPIAPAPMPVMTPERRKSLASNPFGFTPAMVAGEVDTTGSVGVEDKEGRKRFEEERRRVAWRATRVKEREEERKMKARKEEEEMREKEQAEMMEEEVTMIKKSGSVRSFAEVARGNA